MSQHAVRLWKDFDGEPFLINSPSARKNPHLIIANHRKGKPMARRSSRRSYRRRARRNWMSPGVINPRRRRRSYHRRRTRSRSMSNPRRRRRSYTRRRRHYMSNPRRRRSYRRRYRRNPPSFFGLQLPPIGTAIAVAGGFALPAIIEGYVLPYLPDVLTSSTAGRWAVRVGIVAASGMLAKRFVNPRIGNAILIGGGAWLVIQALKEFAPGMIPGLGSQPMLGYYNYGGGMGGYSDGGGMSLQTAPERLDPSTRF